MKQETRKGDGWDFLNKFPLAFENNFPYVEKALSLQDAYRDKEVAQLREEIEQLREVIETADKMLSSLGKEAAEMEKWKERCEAAEANVEMYKQRCKDAEDWITNQIG